jgi:hypothetical protein
MLTLGSLPSAYSAPERPPPPHIVIILADDLGFNDVSYHALKNGNDSNIIHTPAIDALAADGVRLAQYYVQPVCSPTRAALLTGRHGSHTGINAALVDSAPGGLPLDEVLLPQLLRTAGFRTAMIGKWHLGFESWAHTPEARGFDSFFGFYAGSTDYYTQQSECWPWQWADGCFESTNDGEPVSGHDLRRGGRNGSVVANASAYSTHLFTAEAERLIAARRALPTSPSICARCPPASAPRQAHAAGAGAAPLFLYLAHQAVHVGNKPLASHPEYALDQARAGA